MTLDEIRKAVKAGQEVTVAPGVVARGNGFQISFTYKGRRRKETLLLALTAPNLRYSIDTRSAIVRQIQLTGTFDYTEFFPNGNNAHIYGAVVCKQTVKEALEEYLTDVEGKIAFSTWDDYRKSIRYQLTPALGAIRLVDLTTAHLQDWVNGRKSGSKRTRNVLSPLSEVLEQATRMGVLPKNPRSYVVIKDRMGTQELKPEELEDDSDDDEENVDPFTLEEMATILRHAADIPQLHNLIEFAFWTGMRTSELIALRWNRVDLDAGTVRVAMAKVRGKLKRPKTKAGRRTIVLLPAAHAALKRQKAITGKAGKEVFLDPRHCEPWASDKPIRENFWRPLLKQAGIRYRKPYQTRHSYASMMLSAGENPLWVAAQMGHEDWGMIRKHYGRWIPDFDRDAGALAVAVWDAFRRAVPQASQETPETSESHLVATG